MLTLFDLFLARLTVNNCVNCIKSLNSNYGTDFCRGLVVGLVIDICVFPVIHFSFMSFKFY